MTGVHLLKLEIICPTGVVFKGECGLVTVPSVEGDIGVMYGHETIIAALREGTIEVYDDKDVIIKSFNIAGGYAEMKELDKLSLLIET